MVSFNWYKYWVVIGFLREGAGIACSQPCSSAVLRRTRTAAEGPASMRREVRADDLGVDFFKLAGIAVNELRTGIRRAAIKKEEKPQLLSSLLGLLKTYTALTVSQGLPFRVAINNVIIREAKEYCSIHLNKEELLLLWQKVR